jgi:CheY-like chemotaxis protein
MTKKVFVADDSLTTQQFITLALADEDIYVKCAAEGEQAISEIKSVRPDLVLADVSLPGIDGYEICSRTKEDPDLTGTRVVMMVGTFEAFDEEAAARVKCDGHLTKPFDTSELMQIVYSMIRKDDVQTPAAEPEGAQSTSLPSGGIEGFDTQAAPVLISSKTRESFMGSGRILELFTEKDISEAKLARRQALQTQAESAPAGVGAQVVEMNESEPQDGAEEEVAPFSLSHIRTSAEISDEVMDRIVEKVIRRMSQEVIREIAWEVVPELSDVIIRQRLEEQEKKS